MRPGYPRILMVSGEAPPMIGGVGDSTHQLLLEMARLRPEWGWLWLSRRGRRFDPIMGRLGPIRIVRPAFGWGRPSIVLSELAARSAGADLVHVQDEEFSYFHTDAACRIAAAARAPLVTTLHEYHLDRPGVASTAELARRSVVVIANDRRTARRCREHSGRAVDHVLWSANTIPPPRGDAPIPRDPALLSTFGFINGLKQLDAVHAGLRLLRADRDDLRWQVIGPFHPDRNAGHAALAGQLGDDWVRFTGSLAGSELQRRLAASRLMLLPFADGASTRRGSLQVAWAFGLPIVTTRPTEPEPSIVDGRNCVLTPDLSPSAWAAAVRRVLADPALEQRLRRGSLATAEQFSVRRQAEIHIKIYESILGLARPDARAGAAVVAGAIRDDAIAAGG